MSEGRRTYRWPWFVWGAVVIGAIIVSLAVLAEARRVHRMKQERIESGYIRTFTNEKPPAPVR